MFKSKIYKYIRTYIDMLELLLRRAIKMIPELGDLSYEERLKIYCLITLDTWKLKGDQIEVFKMNEN